MVILEGHLLLKVATTPVLAYYYNYVIIEHADARLIGHVAESEFTVCTFSAFLWLARDGAVVPENGYGLPPPCESGFLVQLSDGVHEAPKTMLVMAGLPESGFGRSRVYMVYCRSQEVDWSCCLSNCFLIISNWARNLMFHSVMHLHPVVERLTGISSTITLSLIHLLCVSRET